MRRRSLPPLLASLAFAAIAVVAAPPTSATNDPFWSEQWAMARIGGADAWSRSTGQGITVGVVDTGIDLGHEDLAGKVVASTTCVSTGGDAGRCSGNGHDDHGHGTHVAGIIAATPENGKGTAGVAPGVRLVVAKALDSRGAGDVVDVNAAVKWVVDHGAQVVNLSLQIEGSTLAVGSGPSLKEGIDYAWARGAVPVVASGNQAERLFGGSSNYGAMDAVVVGATGRNDELASYSSSFGTAKWAMVAPGGNASSPNDTAAMVVAPYYQPGQSNLYAYVQGTSQAAPHVAGVIAMLRAQGLGQQAAVDRVLASADRAVACGSGCHGRLDAAAAVGAPRGAQPPPPPPPPPPSPGPQPPRPPRTTVAPQPATVPVPTAVDTTTPVADPSTTTTAAPPPNTDTGGAGDVATGVPVIVRMDDVRMGDDAVAVGPAAVAGGLMVGVLVWWMRVRRMVLLVRSGA